MCLVELALVSCFSHTRILPRNLFSKLGCWRLNIADAPGRKPDIQAGIVRSDLFTNSNSRPV